MLWIMAPTDKTDVFALDIPEDPENSFLDRHFLLADAGREDIF